MFQQNRISTFQKLEWNNAAHSIDLLLHNINLLKHKVVRLLSCRVTVISLLSKRKGATDHRKLTREWTARSIEESCIISETSDRIASVKNGFSNYCERRPVILQSWLQLESSLHYRVTHKKPLELIGTERRTTLSWLNSFSVQFSKHKSVFFSPRMWLLTVSRGAWSL